MLYVVTFILGLLGGGLAVWFFKRRPVANADAPQAQSQQPEAWRQFDSTSSESIEEQIRLMHKVWLAEDLPTDEADTIDDHDLCRRCRDAARIRGERFCTKCKDAVMKEMTESGYLQILPGRIGRVGRSWEQQQAREGDPSPSMENAVRALEGD